MLHTLYVDMNSFFASVEQQLDPHLRGRPVAVVPMDVDTTSVIAASYEAKAFGIKTGTRVGDAKRMCPGLICVQGAHDNYIRMHHAVIAAIDTVLPVDRVCSVDEFACRLLRDERLPDRAAELATRMKAAIRKHCGLCMTSSIGIAPNRFLAKVAADIKKPDGFTIIQKHELPQRLYSLKLMDFPGIGPKMHQRLLSAGISTVQRLCELSPTELRRAWGSIIGEEWHSRLRGEQLHEAHTITRSIGHSNVLSPKRRGEEEARAVAVRLLSKVAQRARAMGYVGEQLTVGVRFLVPRDHPPQKWHETIKLPGTMGGGGQNDTGSLLRALTSAWSRKPKGTMLKLGITLHNLTPIASATPGLFTDKRDSARLSTALDLVNKKWGADTLYPASMHSAKKAAPRRIAFGNIPDLDLPDTDDPLDGD
ncbi:MAG: helix-hairpin-helix domain-containing protein [Planctomycetota bacterium]